MMNSSTSRSRSRSRSRSSSKSRGSRRRSLRSRSHSGSGGGGGDGSGKGQHVSRKDRSRYKKGCSRSEDQYTPHRTDSAALVPVQFTRHVAEDSSDSSEDEDKLEGTDKSRSRDKKIKEVDIANLLSTFE